LMFEGHPHLTDRQRLELYKLMTIKVSVRAHFGQGLDIYWSKNMNVKNLSYWLKNSMAQKILQMYAYKTGAATEGVAEMACVIAGADASIRRAYISLGRAFGISFQIIDDINNFSSSSKWTKTCGEDLSEGKPTYVIIRALELLKPADKKHLQRIICTESMRKNPDILLEGIELIRKSGSLRLCREEAKAMIDKEWARFSKKVPPSEPKMMLRMLISSLLDLAYDV
ncbi:MAG: polyprenyl synthetase family protein, partial [Nitrospirae bacterium]|nr:polyprenyl synthetase family protein [Nitrospirota bacterium]